MKKWITIVVLVILALGYFVWQKGPNEPEIIQAPVSTEERQGHPDPSGGTFIFDDGPMTLSSGRNEKALVPGGSIIEETELLDKIAYGDINRDGKEDAGVFLIRYGAGTGSFTYLAVFASGPVTYRGSETFFLGDRIIVESIDIKNGIIEISYLDRAPNEPLVKEPTLLVTKKFRYANGKLVEV